MRRNARSKSSTMPGFKYKKTIEKEKQRARIRSQNQMYIQSDSVPNSLIQFVEEIHKESRITPAEEVSLGMKTQEAIRLQSLYTHLQEKLEREPTDDEWCSAAGKFNMEALNEAIEDGMNAKNRLVTSNLRMVQRVVNLYVRNGLGSSINAGDMMQEGSMALVRAAEKFEPERGFRFSTYAMYWIRASVKRSQVTQSRSISVPLRHHETFKKYQTREQELEYELGRKPTMIELARDLNVTVLQLERCVKAMKQKCFSLDAQVENKKQPGSRKSCLYDILDVRDDAEVKRIEHMYLRESLISSLRRTLHPFEVDLLLLRFGLSDNDSRYYKAGPLTIGEIGKIVNMKPDKVRRIINNSLKKVQQVIEPDWQYEIA